MKITSQMRYTLRLIPFLILTATLILNVCPISAASDTEFAKNAIAKNEVAKNADARFTDVFISKTNDISRYRIPGLVVTSKGTLLAYCEARRNSSSDWGEIEVHLRRSTDNGKTWTDAVKIAHQGSRIEGNPADPIRGKHEQTVNNPVAIADQNTGVVHFLYCVNYAECFYMKSTDDGVTWSTPNRITSAFEGLKSKYPWTVIATGPGHGIQLTSGRLVVPIWIAYGTGGAHRPSVAGTIFSDDQGKTWQAGEVAFPNEQPFRNPNETIAVERPDGKVVLINRNESDENRKLIAVSADGATNWSHPEFVDDLWEPICMASAVPIPGASGTLVYSGVRTLAKDSSGKLLPGKNGKRQNLSLQVSRDGGKTWPIIRTLDAGSSAYSDLAVGADGSILCLFESRDDIKLARVSLRWIEGD